jgi:hypothetical protein
MPKGHEPRQEKPPQAINPHQNFADQGIICPMPLPRKDQPFMQSSNHSFMSSSEIRRKIKEKLI